MRKKHWNWRQKALACSEVSDDHPDPLHLPRHPGRRLRLQGLRAHRPDRRAGVHEARPDVRRPVECGTPRPQGDRLGVRAPGKGRRVAESVQPEHGVMTTPTHEEFRAVGFTGAAAELPRDELAIVMLAAFNGVRPDQLTEPMKYFPNEATKRAWTNVAE